ncbi:hypothetical protein ACIBI7_50520 [Nonomuraea fuscirosea]|uniref:hypothetical protein n=1 Tax=Nonomuraea fuscirosea TaxID=1291556 RepID=UPI0037A2043A
MSRDRRVPVTGLFRPAKAGGIVPTIDWITVNIDLSDGNTITLDIPQPASAGLDYRDDPRSCWHHPNLLAPASVMPRRCQSEEELVLSIQFDQWREGGQPAYTAAIQPTPERGSP